MRSMKQPEPLSAQSQSTLSAEEAMARRSDISIEPVQDVSRTPLEWWARHPHKYFLTALVARSTLTVPASSAHSVRVFSQARLVMLDNRRWLAPERRWPKALRFEIKGKKGVMLEDNVMLWEL